MVNTVSSTVQTFDPSSHGGDIQAVWMLLVTELPQTPATDQCSVSGVGGEVAQMEADERSSVAGT